MTIKDQLVLKVIPPNNYEHRGHFNNIPFIDTLSPGEKEILEDGLIEKLQEGDDLLVAQTLFYLKSQKALPAFYDFLQRSIDPIVKIPVASMIFQMNGDLTLIQIAINSFIEFEKVKERSAWYMFADLAKFKSKEVNEMIRKYSNHKDFLTSYWAKKTLED
jgi:hypothetical protein